MAFYKIIDVANDRATGDQELIGEFSILYEVNEIPSFNLTFPVNLDEYLTTHAEIEIKVNDKIFKGYLEAKEYDFENMVIVCEFTHMVGKLRHKLTPMNYTVKDKTLQQLASDENLLSPIVTKTFTGNFTNTYEYTFSKNNQIDVLSEICDNYYNLFFRVKFFEDNNIDFFDPYYLRDNNVTGKMAKAEEQSYLNIKIVSDPQYIVDSRDTVNMATAYADKSDNGNSTLTLDPNSMPNRDYIDSNFPLVVTNNVANNDRIYPNYNSLRAGDNVNVEYAMLDLQGVELTDGIIFEGSYIRNDLYPIPEEPEEGEEEKEITEEDIEKAKINLYEACKRYLISQRKTEEFQFIGEPIDPNDVINVGETVLVDFSMTRKVLNQCGETEERVFLIKGIFYIQSIEVIIDIDGFETTNYTLVKDLYTTKDGEYE